jgi:hypothetical protein
MDYEQLYERYAAHEQEVKGILSGAAKLFKRTAAEMDRGALKAALKDIAALSDSAAALAETLRALRDTVEGFDYKEYITSGDFLRQFIAYCESENLDVRGEGLSLEIFPYRVRLDAENSDIYLERKKLPGLRPKTLAEDIVKNRAKLYAAPFNAARFASELGLAYDSAVLHQNKDKRVPLRNADMYLADIYKYLTPMQRFRRDYDKQAYAFDLARLRMSGEEWAEDGRRFQFGLGRNNSKAIRVTAPDGGEYFLSTIGFYDREDA